MMQELIRIDGEPELRVDVLAESAGRANSYLISYGEQVWIVDPSAGPSVWGEDVAAKVTGLIATHGHYDHIAAVDQWRDHKDLPLLGHTVLEKYLRDDSRNVSRYFGRPTTYQPMSLHLKGDLGEICRLDESAGHNMPEDENVSVVLAEGLTMEARYYPGHTAADIVVLLRLRGREAVLFSGDVIFDDSIGRNDLPDGSPADQKESLKMLVAWLKELPGDLPVLSGHGADTTVREVLDGNPYLAMMIR